MGKQELSGYSFPRVPARWDDEGRQFGLGLRKLFDTLFGEQASLSREVLQNNTKISETIAEVEKTSGEKIDTLTQSIEELQNSLKNLQEQLDNDDIDIGMIETALSEISTFVSDVTSWKSETDNWMIDIATWKRSTDLLLDGIVDNLLDHLNRINGIPNLIYPVGIAVVTTSTTAPFSFGSWSLKSGPDADGHYKWERVG